MVLTSAAGLPPSSASKAAAHEDKAASNKTEGIKIKDESSDDDDEESDSSSSSDDDDDNESGSENEQDNHEDPGDVKHETEFPPAPPLTAASGPIDRNSPLGVLRGMVEVAQVCHFLQIFGRILKIPSVSRTDLETALIDGEASSSYMLLVEIFYRLCRDAGQKIEKARMGQDWERVLNRKLVDNWQHWFHSNPMPGPFKSVGMRDRALILHALCEWRLQTCTEIKKHITTITTPSKDMKDVDTKFATLRPEALGRDDKGSIYWYFNDGCWVYAEDSPSWDTTEVKPPYHVRYSTPTKIRLSVHFHLENNDGMDTIQPTIIEDKSKRKRSSKKESKKSKHHKHDRKKSEATPSTPPPPPPPEPELPPAEEAPPVAEEVPRDSSPEHDPNDRNVLCSVCKKYYDMSLLDPPLLKKPQGDWKCFECLVNDCRGWPRRRPSRQVTPAPPPPPPPESSSKKEKRSKKKTSKKSSKKSSSGSSSKKSSSSKKKSKRHHHYPEEYKYLLDIYHTRKRQRDQALVEGLAAGLPVQPIGPSEWRVASASVADLKELLERDFNEPGSMEQQRLKGRLIQILKAGEAHQEELMRIKLREEQQLMWQMEALPRRQSSRVALERLKSQSDPHGKSDDEPWDDKPTNERAMRLSRRSSSDSANNTNGLSAAEIEERNKRRLAMERAHRASRRKRDFDGASSEDEEPRHTRQSSSVSASEWINWKSIHSNAYPLRAVCSALVSRLIQDEMAALFSRPVNPVADGCPDYLSIVKKPMDLGTVKTRSLNGYYTSWEAFKQDMALIWSNCRLYNSEGALIVVYANALEKLYLNLTAQAEEQGVEDMKEDEKETHDSEEEYHKSSDSSSSESSADDSSSSSSSDSDEPRARPLPRSKARSKPPPQKKLRPTVASSSSSESETALPKRNMRAKTIASSSESSDSEANVPLAKKPKSPPPPPPPSTPPPPVLPPQDIPSDSSSSSYFSSSDDSD
ncbi:hypothetical protein AeMF1_009186 [Aphanomyces euteiches]|nr:hypothetical protein AeMF1_009186 [Aphanomyces euteiches]KAH9197118.1 hypothetical protein AeNC1_000927 [Aphanomyces euteiches]